MKRLLIGILILLVCVAGFTGLLVGTKTGLAVTLWQINKWAPEGLKVGSAHGRIIGPLVVNDFAFNSDTFSLAVDFVELNWTPSLLFSRTLKVDELRVEGVRYQSLGMTEQPTEPTEDSEFVLPEHLPVPLSIDLENINIADVSLILSPEEDPVIVQSLQLKLNYSRADNALKTAMLSVESDLLTAGLDLTATTADQYPFEGMLDWHLRLPELATMQGAATIMGDVKEIRIEPVVAAPYSVNALLTLSEPLHDLGFDGSINTAVSDLSAIKTDLPPIGINGQVNLQGTPADVKAKSAINVTGALPHAIQTHINARFQDQILTLEKALVTVADHPVEISSKGTVDLKDASPQMDLVVAWTNAAWPLDTEPLITSPSGTASVNGTAQNLDLRLRSAIDEQGMISATGNLAGKALTADLVWRDLQWPMDGSQVSGASGSLKVTGGVDDYLFELRGKADTAALANVKLQANGKGSQQDLMLEQIVTEALDGTTQGNGNVSWSPDLAFNLSLEGEQINPVHLADEFKGAINFKVIAFGKQDASTLSATLSELTVDGVLRDLPVTASAKGSGQYATSQSATNQSAKNSHLLIALDDLQVKSGSTRISASGDIGETLDVSWSVDSPDLSTLIPDAAGAVVGKGVIYGQQQTPAVDMQLDASTLSYNDVYLKSLKLRANLESSPQGQLDVNFNLSEGQLPGMAISTLQLIGSGQLDDHQLKLSGRSDQGSIDVSMLGAWVEQAWTWDLRKATLAYPELAPWQLQESAGGQISGDLIRVGKTCFRSDDALLCAKANSTSEDLQAAFQIDALPLAYFRTLLPEGLQIAGQLESSGELMKTRSGDPVADIKLLINEGTLDVDNPEDKPVRVLTLQPTSITGQLSAAGLALNTVLDLGQQGKIEADLTVTEQFANLTKGDLNGYIKGGIDDIGFVQELIPALEQLEGRIASDIRIRGTASEPIIAGALTLQDGATEFSAAGIALQDIQATLSGKGGSELLVNTSAKSARGSLSVDGTIDLATSPASINAAISGEDFEVVNTTEAHASVSPDLAIDFSDNTLRINGDVTLPLLHLTPKELPSGAVQVSDDQTFADSDSEEEVELPMDVFANVKIIMGDDILIDAFGLQTGLAGELTIKEAPGKETTASGQLDAAGGTFKAYGQNLKIRRGRIIYVGGPVNKPGFDVEAIRDITSELLVGVRARGALSKPQFSLFSEPSLPESEQMSYLVFGRPLEDNSPGEQSAARKAAMALGVAGGTLLTEKFGDKLGLDEVKIDSELRESGEQASLVVGKYLSPKLFVSYGVGLFEPISALRLNYSISKNVKVITETTESKSGGDLVFTFESDD